MYYNSIYSQLFNFIPRYRFEKIVKKSGGDRYCKLFTAWKQFLTLLFAQISAWFKLGMTELTNRIRDTLMQNQSLLEVLSLDRKILEKPPNWNLPVQEELFSPLLL